MHLKIHTTVLPVGLPALLVAYRLINCTIPANEYTSSVDLTYSTSFLLSQNNRVPSEWNLVPSPLFIIIYVCTSVWTLYVGVKLILSRTYVFLTVSVCIKFFSQILNCVSFWLYRHQNYILFHLLYAKMITFLNFICDSIKKA